MLEARAYVTFHYYLSTFFPQRDCKPLFMVTDVNFLCNSWGLRFYMVGCNPVPCTLETTP